MNRLLTIQDISCVGECSLTVALPVVSACGIETAVLPTALLSTHTAFRHFSFVDLTPHWHEILSVWRAEKIRFSGLYSGYLGSEEQIRLVSSIYSEFCEEDGLFFVDPVMADHGKLYPGFSDSFSETMARLCAKADVIVPNLSEAAFLLKREYPGADYKRETIEGMLTDLTELGSKTAVITGVSLQPDTLGVMAFSKEENHFYEYFTEKLSDSYPGTGDVFASSVVGALMQKVPLEHALQIAADYTLRSMKSTRRENPDKWYGVNFEEELPYLTNRINNIKKER